MTQVALHQNRRESPNSRIERALEAAVVLAALATVAVIIAQEQGSTDPLVTFGDWAAWAVFVADYGILAVLSDNRGAYLRRNWLSAAIIIVSFPLTPPLLATVRLARLARLLRLLRVGLVVARSLRGLRVALGRPGLIYVASATFVLLVVGGSLLTLLEPNTVKGDFWTGMWWAVVTATTIGYGDVSPSTPEGRIVAVILMLTGVGLVATLSASIAAYFVRNDVVEEGEKENAELRDLRERLERIESMLRSRDDAERG